MKYIAAYMLAKLGGKENPNLIDLKEIIESAGIEFNNKKANEIIDKLEGKDLNEVINDGKAKLTIASNPQTIQNEHQSLLNEQIENEHKEEEETLELGGGFDDLFN